MSHLAFSLLVTSLSLHAGGVTAIFDPANPSSGPFPSDALTVADPAQKTGRRVNLPAPDCSADLAPVADAVPVVLSIGGVNSNKVTVAVQ